MKTRILLFLTFLALLHPGAVGQKSADESKVLQICQKVAAKYTLTSADGRHEFQLVERPVLRWSKSTYESVYGNVFIWTDQGVPAAVASIFQFVEPKDDICSEFHSLSTHPIQASVNSQAVWKPLSGGVAYKPLAPKQDVPGESRQRLSQMRSLARRFKASVTVTDQGTAQLRLLPQPIFTYSSDEAGVLDGAMFAFVDQTDPELLLIIEAHQADSRRTWRYAVARFNSYALALTCDDEDVFHAEPLGQLDERSAPYVIIQRHQDDPAFDLE